MRLCPRARPTPGWRGSWRGGCPLPGAGRRRPPPRVALLPRGPSAPSAQPPGEPRRPAPPPRAPSSSGSWKCSSARRPRSRSPPPAARRSRTPGRAARRRAAAARASGRSREHPAQRVEGPSRGPRCSISVRRTRPRKASIEPSPRTSTPARIRPGPASSIRPTTCWTGSRRRIRKPPAGRASAPSAGARRDSLERGERVVQVVETLLADLRVRARGDREATA